MVSLAALSGCASANPAASGRPTDESIRIVRPGQTVELRTSPSVATSVDTLFTPLAEAWRALPAAYAALAIPVTGSDSANHVVTSTDVKLRRQLGNVPLRRYLDCGDSQGVPSAETYEIHLSVVTRIQPGAPGTTITATTIQAMGRPVTFSGDYVRCSSTGALEAGLNEALRTKLRQ